MSKRNRRPRRHLTALPGSGSNSAKHETADSSHRFDSLVAAIAAGELDDDLDRIAGVVSERVAMLGAARSLALMASLAVGDRVRITGGSGPLPSAGRKEPSRGGQANG